MPIKGRTEVIIQSIMDTVELKKYPECDFAFRLVVEEIVTNIVNYAYPANADGEMEVDVSECGDSVVMSTLVSLNPGRRRFSRCALANNFISQIIICTTPRPSFR